MKLVDMLLKNNITIRIKTQGSSMLPFIRTGDYVIIKPALLKEVKIGDIIAYSKDGNSPIVCHRLIKIEDSILITKGDTHIHGYERITKELLLGKVINIEDRRRKINLDTKFQRFLGSKIAYISLGFPKLFFVFICFIEGLRAPHLVPIKFIRRLKNGKQGQRTFFSPLIPFSISSVRRPKNFERNPF